MKNNVYLRQIIWALIMAWLWSAGYQFIVIAFLFLYVFTIKNK